jgi:hypothetical protein
VLQGCLVRYLLPIAATSIGLLAAGPGVSYVQAQEAQEVVTSRAYAVLPNQLMLQANPFAGYAGYARRLSGRWYAGAGVGGGPSTLVQVSGAGLYDDEREGGHAGVFIGYAPSPYLQLEVCPLRLSLLLGNDYGAVYPSAEMGVMAGTRRFKAGSRLVVVRVAGPNGTGDYPLFWIPLNLRYTLAW